MKRLIFFLWLVSISQLVMGQKELNNWFFGNNAGLNFGSGAPVALGGSAMVSEAGCSSISDKQGNLLFYTNGVTVWNRNHVPMPNGTGLNGDPGSTQTVLITYHPGDENLYYIFTVDKNGGSKGLQYSVVDVRLDGGRGDIDVNEKNVSFNLPVTEKITAVKHKNGRDIWLVVHRYEPNTADMDAFVVFHIDCKGILGISPQFYHIGSSINLTDNTRGYMKFSPDGKKLVTANFVSDFEIFDFDNATGDITNAKVIPATGGNSCGPYGVEFSPDSRLLYVSESYTCKSPVGYNIYQYKLDPDINTTIASKVTLDNGTTVAAGALQLGPDNKIYIAFNGANYLGVINNPNVTGTGCNLAKASLLQAPASSAFGLPNVIAGFKRDALGEDTTVCNGSSLTLKLNLQATTYLWSTGSPVDSIVVTKAGKYWVDFNTINPNGFSCPVSDTINVNFQTSPVINLGNDTLLCEENFPLLLAPSVPGASFLWQDSTTTATHSAKAQGIYWLEATTSGCTSKDFITITSVKGTPFYLGADTTICPGDSIQLTVSIPAARYVWSDGSTSNKITAKTAGMYWCRATNSTGCVYTDSINITLKPLPVVNLGKDSSTCQDKFPILLTQSIPGATYLWADGSTANSFSVPGKGIYWLKVTVNGCSAIDSIDIKETPVTPFKLGADTIICTNAPYNLSVGPVFTSYLWNTGSTAQSISITASGTYWCEAKNGNGCSYRDSIEVTIKPLPVVNLGADTTICQNLFPLTLNPSITGATYIWKGGSTAASFPAPSIGTYWVQATVNGCSASDTIVIAENPVTTFSLGTDTTICSNGSYVLTVGPVFTSYLWSNGSTAKSISVSRSGTYWCEATTASGCGYRDSIDIIIKPIPAINLGADTVICQSQFPLVLNQSISGATYIWQDGSTASSFSVPARGNYWVTGTLNGCSKTDSITIDSRPVISFNLGADTLVCTNTPYVLTVNPAFTNYLWSNGSTSRSISVTTDGLYWCEASNGVGCSFRDSIDIKLRPSPVINLGKDTSICQNQFPLLISQAIPGASYLWQDGSTGSSFSVPSFGTYWLKATLNGCSSTDTIAIKSNPLTSFTLGADTAICSGSSYILTVKPAFANYLWNTGSTSASISVTTSGVYWCEVSNSSGCSYRDSIDIKISRPPVVNLGNDTTICTNSFPLAIGKMITGASYLWQDGSTNAIYSVAVPGRYWVTATAGGCSASDTIIVTALAATSFNLGPDTVMCTSSPLTIKANIVAANYLWNTGSTAASITVNNPGVYWCEINRGLGCVSRDTVKVNYAPPIAFSLGRDTAICNSRGLLLDVTNTGDSYLWQDNSRLPTYQVTASGYYFVTVTKGGCSKADTIAVKIGAVLVPDIGADTTICPGQELLLDAGVAAQSYKWQDGSTQRTYKVTAPGRYSVQVSGECGIESDEIIISSGACKLMIPNAFTPGKNINNHFRILNGSALKDFDLRIFNRWGQQVFQASKPEEGWDGKCNGIEQPPGTYVYTVSYLDSFAGKKNSQKGVVVLIR